MNLDQAQQQARRDLWFATTRSHLDTLFNSDGTGKMPQFNAPWREPVWILPALYTGEAGHVALANRVVERYAEAPSAEYKNLGQRSGMEWGIFQSNTFSHCLHRFEKRLTPGAREVMEWHARETCKTVRGSRQPDYKFHGANDNMPMMGTCGMIFAGETLGIPEAVDHGLWNLQEVRRLLSRAAWMSEFNSSTYSAITLSGAAKLAAYSRTAEVRELALQIEHRLWAEILLHYHPGTFMQAGPQCRAYPIDCAGHTHTLQALLWVAFGDAVGRDPIRSLFSPDGREVLHFAGNPWQSIAEYCDAFDTDLHVPEGLANLIGGRQYPAALRGRSECISRYDDQCGAYHTETYMEEAFSLGTVNGPLCGGEHTTPFYATYRRQPDPREFRDAGSVFPRYLIGADSPAAGYESSADGAFCGDRGISSQGWFYAMQSKNTALALCTPNLKNLKDKPLETDSLRLSVIFPAHYGRIARSIIGDGPARDGATGESVEVVPVSVEAGEVFIHIQPLLPTNLPRKAAVRFGQVFAPRLATSDQQSANGEPTYEYLDLINYEGPLRVFTRAEAAVVLNGLVLTLAAKAVFPTLEEFHRAHAPTAIRDYYAMKHRYLLYQRKDVEMEVWYTPDPFGVQTATINGRAIERPVFESSQFDVTRLPFMSGDVPRSRPFFPWKTMEICWYPDFDWLIGSRGLPGETPYENPLARSRSNTPHERGKC